MRKQVFVAFIILIAISCTACTGALYGRSITAFSDDDIADDRMEELISAIENKDKDKIKGMLSQNTKNSVKDIETQIDDLIHFYQGELVSCDNEDCGMVVRSSREDEDYKTIFEMAYVIVTTTKQYQIALEDVVMNDFDTKDEGISYIYMKEISDYSETEYTYWGDYDTDPERGIHLRQMDKESL